jgi:ABC-type sugar transport system permease subunit
LNREVLEAAQIDGATEWQTLRRVTVPMLRPVLVVVFVTMLINVLKIFDIVVNMAAPSSQAGASTIALDIWHDFESPTGQGLAAALAVRFGSPLRAMVAGLVLGVVEATIANAHIGSLELGLSYREVLPLAFVLLLVALRPQLEAVEELE